MNRHLVTVEIGVERSTNQRVKLDCLALYKYRFESLYAQSVQSRRTIEHYRVLLDNIFKHIPDFCSYFFDHSLGALDIMRLTVFYESFHNKRLKQLKRHFFRKSALIESQLRSYYDYRTARIVNTLTQKVLSESSLLTLEHIRKRFKRS